jgi:DNA-binding response OmpR family regulator
MARILVVEDSPTIVSTVEWILRQNGHQVYIARDGLTALASVRAFVPDLVLLDILLPHTNGFEVCTLMRKNPVYNAVRVVMMTCLKDEADIQRAYKVGANGYITKPFQEASLLDTVNQYLANKDVVVNKIGIANKGGVANKESVITKEGVASKEDVVNKESIAAIGAPDGVHS